MCIKFLANRFKKFSMKQTINPGQHCLRDCQKICNKYIIITEKDIKGNASYSSLYKIRKLSNIFKQCNLFYTIASKRMKLYFIRDVVGMYMVLFAYAVLMHTKVYAYKCAIYPLLIISTTVSNQEQRVPCLRRGSPVVVSPR